MLGDLHASTTFPLRCAGDIPSTYEIFAQGTTVHIVTNSYVLQHFPLQTSPELLTPIDYNEIRSLTATMHQQISSGTLDAPSWRLVRNAKLAGRMYAPLGTTMTLGDYVRVVRTFLEAFKLAEAPRMDTSSDGDAPPPAQVAREDMKIVQLGRDLKFRPDSRL